MDSLSPVVGVRVSKTFHLTCVHFIWEIAAHLADHMFFLCTYTFILICSCSFVSTALYHCQETHSV